MHKHLEKELFQLNLRYIKIEFLNTESKLCLSKTIEKEIKYRI